MSATVSNVTQSLQPTQGLGNNSTSSYAEVITTTIYPSNSDTQIITTIITTGTPLPTTPVSQPKSDLPVAAIAGGTAGGVVLAVAAVIIWTWWGRCIKRKREKEREQLLASLQVRENTRRNASSGSYTRFPSSFSSSRHERKVTFVPTPPSTPSPIPSALRMKEEAKAPQRGGYPESLEKPQRASTAPHKPPRPSPLGRNNSRHEQAPLLVSTGRTEYPSPSPRPSPAQSTATSPVQPFLKRPLTHKSSAASSMSAYSTASGEERQKRVSTSLIMAALGHMDPRRSWLGNYLPLSAPRNRGNNDLEASRLSRMSTASMYSQPDDIHGGPVGYAYGGEEGPQPR